MDDRAWAFLRSIIEEGEGRYGMKLFGNVERDGFGLYVITVVYLPVMRQAQVRISLEMLESAQAVEYANKVYTDKMLRDLAKHRQGQDLDDNLWKTTGKAWGIVDDD